MIVFGAFGFIVWWRVYDLESSVISVRVFRLVLIVCLLV